MKIAIVGGSPGSVKLAPYDNETWQIWGLAFRTDLLKRFDRLYEIHDDLSHKDAEYPARILALNVPLIVGKYTPIKGDQVSIFPFERAEALMNGLYLTSSLAYMMAHAILEGATEIGLYGCDLAVDDEEYFYQRPCLEAWIGLARGRGIKVMIPGVSPLAKSNYLYGSNYQGDKDVSRMPFTMANFEALATLHNKKAEETNRQIEYLKFKLESLGGAAQAYERLAKIARAVEAGQVFTNLTNTLTLK